MTSLLKPREAGGRLGITEGALPNIYRRGAVYWGRIQIDGREIRWSLGTSDASLAARKVEERRRQELSALPEPDGVDFRWGDPARYFGPLTGSIYFIWHTDRVKIGYARNVLQRLARLQTGSAERLHLLYTCPGSKKMEGALHATFANERLTGEWFRLSRRIFEWIADRHG